MMQHNKHFLILSFLKNRNEGKNETLKQQLCTDPKGTMATPGDCPRSELQVISVLLFENLYLNWDHYREWSSLSHGLIMISLDLRRWPPPGAA